MKALRRIAVSLVAAVAVCVGLALYLVDAESVRDAVAARLEAALGAPVELGAVDLSLFPLPGARIRDVRIGAASARWVEAPELRAAVSLVALFTGNVVVRSLELDSPRVWLPEAAPAPGWRSERTASGNVHFAITHLRVRDGRLEAGPLALERVSVDGSLGPVSPVELDFSAELPGLGQIEGGTLSLADASLPPGEWRWSADAKLAQLDLLEVSRRLGLADVFGTADGSVTASGRGREAEHVSVELESADFDLKGELLRATGRAKLRAEIPGAVAVDLGGAQITIVQSLEKPASVPLTLTARLEPPARGLRFSSLRIEAPGLRADGDLDLGGPRPLLELRGGALDLAALAGWRAPERMPKQGRIALTSARIAGSPLTVRASGELAGVQVPLDPKVTLAVSGPVTADGTTVTGRGLRVAFGEDAIEASLGYDWRAERVSVSARAHGVRIGPLVEALWNRTDISGRLHAEVELAGGLALETLAGGGSFDLQDGELPGISMARAAGLERTWENPPGLDRFERLFGRFETAGDHWDIPELHLQQEYVTAQLEGKLWLDKLSPDLTGAVQLDFPELGGPDVRTVLRVGGPLDALEVVLSEEKSDEIRDMEAQMIEAIRKTEERERAARRE